jgi:hypothetical protein
MPRRRSKVDFRPEMETRRPRPRNRLDLSAMTIRAVLLGMMFWTAAVYTYESFGLSRAANVRSSMVLDVGAVVRDAGTLGVSAASRDLGLINRYHVFSVRGTIQD